MVSASSLTVETPPAREESNANSITDETNYQNNKKVNMKKKSKEITLAEAQAQVKKVNPSFILRKVYEEYQVVFGKGRGTYFTDDLQDALDTATLNGKQKEKEKDDNSDLSK